MKRKEVAKCDRAVAVDCARNFTKVLNLTGRRVLSVRFKTYWFSNQAFIEFTSELR